MSSSPEESLSVMSSEESFGATIGILILFILGAIGTIMKFAPLPDPDFTSLRKIFKDSFDRFQQKKRGGSVSEENKIEDEKTMCFVCLCDCEEEEFVYFGSCFHKCCTVCCIALFEHDVRKSIRNPEAQDDFDEINLRPREGAAVEQHQPSSGGFLCPLCRRGVLAVIPSSILINNNSINNDEHENKDFIIVTEKQFPKELRTANHTLYHQHRNDKQDDNNDGNNKDLMKLFATGSHLGFGRSQTSFFSRYDWRKFGDRVIIVGFILSQICMIGSAILYPSENEDDIDDVISIDF